MEKYSNPNMAGQEVARETLDTVLEALNIPQEERAAYKKNTEMAEGLLFVSKYVDLAQGKIDIAAMVAETGLDLSKTLVFRGADKKELTPTERDVETFWTVDLKTATQYANNKTECGGEGTVLVTTLNKLPDLNNLLPHYLASTVVAYGKTPEILGTLDPNEIERKRAA